MSESLRAQVWAQVRAQVRDQVRAQVRDQVWDQVWDQVRDQVRAQVWDQVWAQVGDIESGLISRFPLKLLQITYMKAEGVRYIYPPLPKGGTMAGKQIDKLTPAQEEQLPIYKDRWLKIGLSTEPANRTEAENGLEMAYNAAGFKAPKQIIWGDSPLAICLLAAEYKTKQEHPNLKGKEFEKAVNSILSSQVWDCGYGQHDANWLAFYAFCREVLGLVAETDKLQGLTKICQNAGWFLPLSEEVCFVAERHNILGTDSRGRLHSDTGPAIGFPDNFNVYASHGVRLPDYIIEHPEQITPDKINKEQNAEIRRVMIEKFGTDRYVQEMGSKPEDIDEQFGSLYRTKVAGDEDIVMVKVRNSTPEPDGSIKDYWLRVPPTIKTAQEAVAWTFSYEGEQAKDYAPVIET